MKTSLKTIKRALYNNALSFQDKLKINSGYKYTVNHDYNKYPAAVLYGTWSAVFLNKLLGGKNWKNNFDNHKIIKNFNLNRLKNGLFWPKGLDQKSITKSKEYLQLHCYNYSVGAALEIDCNYDFSSSYMDSFLDPDFLGKWLDQRSLQRPWEESNNIVNVASYLALCNDNGNKVGRERLYQMLEWHHLMQNPLTGGFDNLSLSRKNILQSMAGAVHNFHIHHYLNEPMKYESMIANNMKQFLFEGPLTACLSIDFVELACKTIDFLDESYELEQALIFHLNCLIRYQNTDGGWFENDNSKLPTKANGMIEEVASSNSYATWFRSASIIMIINTLLKIEDDSSVFRKTLGMGYWSGEWSKRDIKELRIDKSVANKYFLKNLKNTVKKKVISLGVKLFN
jgi:hypothetical protein